MVKWGLVLKDSKLSLTWILFWLHHCCHTVQLIHLKCTYSCIYAIAWHFFIQQDIFDSIPCRNQILKLCTMTSKLFLADLKDILQHLFEFFCQLTSTDFKAFSFFISSLSDFDLLKIVTCKAPKWSHYKLTTLAVSLRPCKCFQTYKTEIQATN